MSKVFLIANPVAGGGRFAESGEAIVSRARELGIACNLAWTERQGHAKDLATNAPHADAIWVAGGDGTVSEVVHGLAGRAIPIGVLPCGTGNDFADNLGLPGDLASTVLALSTGRPRSFDYGRVRLQRQGSVHECVLVNVLGFGIDAEAAARANAYKRWLGSAGYTVAVVRSLFGWRSPRIRVKTDSAVDSSSDRLLVAVCNGPRTGGTFRIAPAARPDDGSLDVCVIEHATMTRCLRLLPTVRSGKHVAYPEVTTLRATEVAMSSSRPLFAHVDGEVFGDVEGITVSIVPHGARFLVPETRS